MHLHMHGRAGGRYILTRRPCFSLDHDGSAALVSGAVLNTVPFEETLHESFLEIPCELFYLFFTYTISRIVFRWVEFGLKDFQ